MDKRERQTIPDRQIVRDALAGGADGFARLVEQHQHLVWHLVYRMVQHPEDCRELCQDVFLRVHRNLHQFRFQSTLATWIGRIAYHVSVRHLQRKRLPLADAQESAAPIVEDVADDFDLAAVCANDDLLAKLHLALERLAPIPRTMLTLYYLHELSVSEIASIMEKPEGTVKNALFRARAQLREQFAQHLEIVHDKT
ncbi:RNA polymerase sigma factor [Alteromonas oceanisediminis]|uniref:RNA polymerase sigma factor n=1 Tax=Alteromonas oceanisediminis TaxID=2836180 RepID=UPI001BD9868E|nr:RNA polymerase sigma factor [Alteromonas oceanisediminis]MBT0586168.1 RNA polymerase sigma factor [Alteromonas oceanisediminis]